MKWKVILEPWSKDLGKEAKRVVIILFTSDPLRINQKLT